MENIVELVTTNGLSVAIIIYFLYKDYRFNESILQVLGEVREVLAKLSALHGVEDN